jgi:ribosomal-protein-alanine N-acetyltransferase
MPQPTSPRDIPELKFRPMRLADIPRVHEIDRLSFPLPWPEKSFTFELTENPSTLTLVAESQPKDSPPILVGMSIVWIIVDEAHIATIAIHPDFRGNGYGKSLLAESLRQSIGRGAEWATLEVRESNLVAQQMYRSFRFTIVGRRLRYYRDNNEDAVIMTVDNLGSQYLAWLDKYRIQL